LTSHRDPALNITGEIISALSAGGDLLIDYRPSAIDHRLKGIC